VHVETPAGFVVAFGRVDFSVSHRGRVTRVHVFSGRVVVKAGIIDDSGDWVEGACNRQVSFQCLKRMPRSLVVNRGRSRRIVMH
jgi:hypothetical protein